MAIQGNNRLSHFIPASLLAVSLLAGCGGQTASEYIDSAENYIKQDDRAAAVIELKNALKQEPKNAMARRLLGESYLVLNKADSAEKELTQALKLGADPVIIYPSLLRAFNLQNKFQEVVEQAIPKGLSKSDDILASVLRGVAYLSLKKVELARLQFETASEIDSSAPFSQLGQAYYASAQDNMAQALLVLNSLLEKEADFTEALMLKARLMLAKKDYAQAALVYKKLIELEPKNLSYQLQLAQMYLQQNLYKEAKAALVPVMKRFPKHPYSNLILAEVEFRQSNFQASKEAATQVLLSMEGNIKAKYLLGLSNYKLNDYEQAHRYLTAVAAVTPKQNSIRRTIAVIEYEMGYLDEAAETLSTLKTKSEDESKLLEAIGIKQVGEKNYAAALDNLTLASQLDPENYKLKARIGVLKLADNDDSGLADLDAALSGDASLGKVKLYEALYYIEKKQYTKALAMAKEWQSKVEGRAEGYNLEGLVYLEQLKFEQASAQFEKAVAIEPGNRVARSRLAAIAAKNGDLATAKKQLLALLEAYPEDNAVHVSLAGLALKAGNKEEAKSYFETSLKKNPQADHLRVPYIQLLAHLNEFDAAMQVLEQMEEAKQTSPELLVLKADLLQAQKKTVQARLSYRAALEKQPTALNTWVKLLASYQAEKDSEGLALALGQALKQNPNSLMLQRLEITELIKVGKFEVAHQKIDSLRAKEELLSLADELDSAVYLNDNKIKKAVDAYKKAFERAPTEYKVVQLSGLLSKAKQSEEAKQVLQSWLSTHPEDEDAKQALAMLLHSSEPDLAVKQYRELLESNPNNVTVLNNLAWTLAERGETLEALKLAKHAVALAPDSAAVLDTYGFTLLTAKEFATAIPVLEKASQLASRDLSIKFHLAQAYHNQGRDSDAKIILEQLQTEVSENNATFPEQKQAMSLLQKL